MTEPQTLMENKFTYVAFISYKREDKKWARWLHRKLEHYKIPNSVRRNDAALPERVRPIFRDVTDLEPGVLSENIRRGLEQSSYLIVLCSPRSAKSKYVNYEIEEFIRQGKERSVIPFIIEGSPNAADPAEECFPPALRRLSAERELLGANISEMGRHAAAVKVVSRMFGIRFNTLWQRFEREQRRQKWFIVAVSLLVAAAAFGLAMIFKSQNTRLLLNQGRAVAQTAERLIDEGDLYTAQRLCLEVLPKHLNKPNRPYVPEAERVLRLSFDRLHRPGYQSVAVLRGHTYDVNAAAFSPDGTKIVTASGDGTVRVWDSRSGGELLRLEGHSDIVNAASFNADGSQIVSASYDGSIRLWDAGSGRPLRQLEGHGGGISTAEFSADGTKILSASQDGTVRLWEVATGRELLVIDEDEAGVTAAHFSPDGTKIVTAAAAAIRIRDAATGRELRCLEGHEDDVNCAEFSTDGTRIVSASFDETVRVWEASTGREVLRLTGHGDDVDAAAFSADGSRIVSASAGTIRIWDARTGRQLQLLEGHTGSIYAVRFSPEADRIVSASVDRTVRLWQRGRAEELAPRIETADHDCDTCTGECIHKGRKLVLSAWDIGIRDEKSDRELRLLEGHTDEVIAASFTADGRRIVSVSNDETIRIWDAETGKELQRFEEHDPNLTEVHFTADGAEVVTVSEDGRRRHRSFPPLQQLIDRTRERFSNRPLSSREKQRYYLE